MTLEEKNALAVLADAVNRRREEDMRTAEVSTKAETVLPGCAVP